MLVIVTRVCYGHVNPRSAFLDHSWALFQVREKEVEKKKGVKKLKTKITIFFFHGLKMIFSGESKNRRKFFRLFAGGAPYSFWFYLWRFQLFLYFPDFLFLEALEKVLDVP